VISLDFELHWGVREFPLEPRRSALLQARRVVPRLLDLFQEFEVAATWATVGMLFAETRQEMQQYFPGEMPSYTDARLDPYTQPVGADEEEDPLHFAPSLIRAIQRRPRQEIGSHTFSHYYCCEPGQKLSQFKADLKSAVAIAAARGVAIQSIVLPRNQVRSDYVAVLPEFGIGAYRGVQRGYMGRYICKAGPFAQQRSPVRRAGRLLDAYLNLSGAGVFPWPDPANPAGDIDFPSNVPASRYFRCDPTPAWAHRMQIARIAAGLRQASEHGQIFHFWGHPEDFATNMEDSLATLRQVLKVFRSEREARGMRSLTMSEAAGLGLGGTHENISILHSVLDRASIHPVCGATAGPSAASCGLQTGLSRRVRQAEP